METQDKIKERWVLIDTETTGLSDPVYPIEIAAQVMKGWEPEGEPFRSLINFDVPIEPAAVKIHKYTRNYLKNCGMPPREALQNFQQYAGDLPLAAYNLSFDWDKVVVPTLTRMNMPNLLKPGFCVLNLVRNVVAGVKNYRLITVLKAFGIAEKQRHHALDDVNMVIRLLGDYVGPHLQNNHVACMDDVQKCAGGSLKIRPLFPYGEAQARKSLAIDPDGRVVQGAVGTLDDFRSAVFELMDICRRITRNGEMSEEGFSTINELVCKSPYQGDAPFSYIRKMIYKIIPDHEVSQDKRKELHGSLVEMLRLIDPEE